MALLHSIVGSAEVTCVKHSEHGLRGVSALLGKRYSLLLNIHDPLGCSDLETQEAPSPFRRMPRRGAPSPELHPEIPPPHPTPLPNIAPPSVSCLPQFFFRMEGAVPGLPCGLEFLFSVLARSLQKGP